MNTGVTSTDVPCVGSVKDKQKNRQQRDEYGYIHM